MYILCKVLKCKCLWCVFCLNVPREFMTMKTLPVNKNRHPHIFTRMSPTLFLRFSTQLHRHTEV